MVNLEAKSRGLHKRGILWSMRLPAEEHIHRTAGADLFLDTPWYNAHTVATDTYWAGVPILTMRGDGMAARVASSIGQAIGDKERGEWPLAGISSLKEYEDLAAAAGAL